MLTAAIIQAIATAVLVGVTCWYVRLTRGILEETAEYTAVTKAMHEENTKQARLIYSPVIGITIKNMTIGQVWGDERRNFGIELRLDNVGNAAAIEVRVDAVVTLRHVDIEGEDVIPARFKAATIPFIEASKFFTDSPEKHLGINFGNKCIWAIVDDMKVCWDDDRWVRVAGEVIQSGSRPRNFEEGFELLAKQPMLTVVAYYRNHIGQFFKSTYRIMLNIPDIVDDGESYDVGQVNVPRPYFHAEPIDKEVMDEELDNCDSLREIGGW